MSCASYMPIYTCIYLCLSVCVEIKLVQLAKSIAGSGQTWPIKQRQVNIS